MTTSVVGGLLGGLLGAAVMSVAHALVSAVRQTSAPPASQEEDATVKVAQAFSLAVRGRALAECEKPAAGSAVHYGFGVAMGAVYGVTAMAAPVVTIGAGTGFGAAVWLGAHATVVPALGLASSPLRQPRDKEAQELALHLLYGVTAELVRRVVQRVAGPSRP